MQIRTNIKNNVGIITINRPDSLNAMNKQIIVEFVDLLENFISNKDIRVIVITGSGDKAFIAGADIKQMQKMNEDEAYDFAKYGHKLTNLIENSIKPVIAAVNGFALGGGCEIALACHIRIASKNAVFGQPEVKIGLLPGWGGTQRLPRIVGKGLANELILTGKNIDSEKALEIGLINKIAIKEDLLNSCLNIANLIINNSPNAIAESIKLVNFSSGVTLKEGLPVEAKRFSELFKTKETKEGLTAFIEKRNPRY